MKPIRIGMIGVGQIAKHHLNTYRGIPGAKVVAAADINADELASVAKEYEIENPVLYQNLMLDLKRLEGNLLPDRNFPNVHTSKRIIIAGNYVKYVSFSDQLSRVNIRQEKDSNKEVYEKLIKMFESHPLFNGEKSQQTKVSGRDFRKQDVTQLVEMHQEVPESKNILDRLAIRWVNRSSSPHQNMSEFLRENYSVAYLSESAFKRHLQDAYKRGIIDKLNRRYKPRHHS